MSQMIPKGLPAFLATDPTLTPAEALDFLHLFKLASVTQYRVEGERIYLNLAWEKTWFATRARLDPWMGHEDDAIDVAVYIPGNEKLAQALFVVEGFTLDTVQLDDATASFYGKATHYPADESGAKALGLIFNEYGEHNRALLQFLNADAHPRVTN